MFKLSDIKKLLGNFWLQIFQDSVFIQNILDLYNRLIIPKTQLLFSNLYNNVELSNTIKPWLQPAKLNIAVQSPRYRQLTFDQQDIDLSNTTLTFADLVNQQDYQIQLPIYKTQLVSIRHKVYNQNQNDSQYKINKDFTVHNGKLYISKSTYKEITQSTKIKKQPIMINGQFIQHYILWGDIVQQPKLLDKCCSLLHLPNQWAYLHPNVVARAFKSSLCGMTVLDALVMLGQLAQCPVCQQPGKVSTIIHKNGIYFISIGDRVYKSKYEPIVEINQQCPAGKALFCVQGIPVPSYYTYKDAINQTILPSITLQTKLGDVTFKNKKQEITTTNFLPGYPQAYIGQAINYNYPVLGQLIQGDQINPVQFLIKNVYKKYFCLFKIPDNNLKLQSFIIQLIKNNTRKSATVLFSTCTNITVTQPIQLHIQQSLVQYYLNSEVLKQEIRIDSI